jgi:hypothetical protein
MDVRSSSTSKWDLSDQIRTLKKQKELAEERLRVFLREH